MNVATVAAMNYFVGHSAPLLLLVILFAVAVAAVKLLLSRRQRSGRLFSRSQALWSDWT